MKYLKSYNLGALPEKKDRLPWTFPNYSSFYLGEDKSSCISLMKSRFFDRKSQFVLVDIRTMCKNKHASATPTSVKSSKRY